MDTAHSNTRCPVYLHPAAASNPATVRSIQQATRQLVCIMGGRPQLQATPAALPTADSAPFGGDVA